MMNKFNSLFFLLILFPWLSFGQWIQTGQNINGLSSDDGSGVSISLSADGSIVAVGASDSGPGFVGSGYVRVFQNQSGNWTQIGNAIEGNGNFDQFGYAISLSADGNFLAVGADSYSPSVSIPNRGRVRVYQNQSGSWVQVGQDLEGEAAEDYFGFWVSMSEDGSRVAIGAPVNGAGYVKVYENQSGTWTSIGQKIEGEASEDQFGINLGLSNSGTVIAIGADLNDGNGTDSGHVRVFEEQAGNWVQIGQDIDGDASEDFFGLSVSLSSDGSVLAVGGIGNDDNGDDSGHVKVYENQSGNWVQIGQDIDGESGGGQSGFSVSLSSDGSIVAIGAEANNDNGANAGQVRIYQNQSGSWVQLGDDIEGNAAGDQLGFSVSLSSDGTMVAIGSPGDNDNGSDAGQAKIFQNTSILSIDDFSSSAYSFTGKDGKINVITDDPIQLTVYTMLGVKVSNEHLPTGLYLARIMASNGSTVVRKVLVE
jgi:hypothetical protein